MAETTRMNTLDRHIGSRVIRGYVLVMAVLLSVFSLMAFVNELGDVGRGTYTLRDAVLHVLLTLPHRVVDLAPATALVGSIVGLGELAEGRELMAMLASRISPLRIGWSVVKAGAVLMLAVVGVQEFVAPQGDQLAFKHRSQAISGIESLQNKQGFWFRDEDQVINVRRVLHGQVPADVLIYQFGEEGRLRRFTSARQARIQDRTRWQLVDVVQRTIGSGDVVTTRYSMLPWETFLMPEQLSLLIVPVDTLSPSALYHYVQYLKEAGQSAERAELALWLHAGMPLSTLAMVLVVVPFVLGPLREFTPGKRVLHGSLVGVGFYLGSQLLAHVGSVLHAHAALITLTPLVILCGAGVWLYRRVS